MSLPEPDPAAAQVSAALTGRIRAEIASRGGWMPFSRYMEMALYEPGLGYYAAGSRKFGAAGDFVTAPELSPLFGAALARTLAPALAATGGDVLELGAGSGRLALDLLTALENMDALPGRYRILEVSADLRERQEQLLQREAPRLAARVEWLDALPGTLRGAVLGNEVLDALPVHLVVWGEEGPRERGVACSDGGFQWTERAPSSPALDAAARRLGPGAGYLSEVGLAAPALAATLGERLEAGLLLFVDYGFGESEYYHPQRRQGTLMCHYRHRAHTDPFHLPGLQDITSHVDFSAVARAGRDAGLDLAGYTTQARFLIDCGIADLLARGDPWNPKAYLPQSAAVQKLLSPAEMGELFKVIGLSRGLTPPLPGFRRGGLARLL